MKGIAGPLLIASAIMSGISLAQAANVRTAPPRACSLTERAARSECPDRPSDVDIPAQRLASADDRWVVSETTSPVDYSPIATATTSALNGSGSSAMRLSIRCRSGRTELIVAGSGITGRGDEYFISYRVNGGQSAQLAGIAPSSGDGVAFKGDVAALLQSFPGEGQLVVRVLSLSGSEVDAIFSLDGLDALRTRIRPICRWPHAIAKPNDR
jgi:hypothetical protein